jgi:hypothetical protein
VVPHSAGVGDGQDVVAHPVVLDPAVGVDPGERPDVAGVLAEGQPGYDTALAELQEQTAEEAGGDAGAPSPDPSPVAAGETRMATGRGRVADAARRGSSVEGCVAYVTHFPCVNCAKILAAAGIAEVKYRTDYHNDPLVAPLLADAGVKILKL